MLNYTIPSALAFKNGKSYHPKISETKVFCIIYEGVIICERCKFCINLYTTQKKRYQFSKNGKNSYIQSNY